MRNITICIPVHDPYERHLEFILEALNSIRTQTLLPKEVLLSGSYRPSYIEGVITNYSKFFPIRFLNNDSISTSTNLNQAIVDCSGPLVKILFQDDFFISNSALADINYAFEIGNTIWVVSASRNFDSNTGHYVRDIVPKFKRKISNGVNSIGSPSVVAFRKDHFLPFNEDLIWMLDCEWYLSMQHMYGDPKVISDFHIANRLHRFQATHYAKYNQDVEKSLVNNIHTKSGFWINLIPNSSQYKCLCLEKCNE
jgi:hypothetical protein